MTELEQFAVNVQRQIDAQNSRIDTVLAKVDATIREMHDMRQEMRDRDNQRAAEIMELRQKQQSDAKEFSRQLHSNFVQTMIGVGAIMAAIGGFIIAAVR